MLRRLSVTPGWRPEKTHGCLAVTHHPPLAGMQPGVWQWTCPACGERMTFDVVPADAMPVPGPQVEDALAGVKGCGDEIPG